MISSINWKIVLVDDEKDIRQVMSIVLTDAGYDVSTARDGKSGIRLCKEVSPQIVITDIRMPGIDGIQVLEAVKEHDPDTEVIVITAFGEIDPAIKALQRDASDFITKPVNDEVLLIAVNRAQCRYIAKKQLQGDTPFPGKKRDQIGYEPIEDHFFQKKLIESSMDGALICDLNGRIVALNEKIAQMLGYSNIDMLHKMPFGRLFSSREEARFKSELASERYGGKNRLVSYEASITGRSGNSIPVQISATVLLDQGREVGLVCFFKDLGEKKILSDQWIQLIDQLNIGAFTIDLDRRIISFNSSAQTLTGLKETEVIGKDCREIFSDIPCYAKCPCHVGGGQDTEDLSVEITDLSNVKHLVTRLSAPLYGPENCVVGCLTLLQDHAALADLINKVNYEERSLKMILDNLDIGIFTVNRGGYITFFNREAEIITGYNRRQVLGRPSSVIFEKGNNRDSALLKESIASGEFRANRKSRIVTSNGETVPVRADYIPLHNDQGLIVGGLATLQDLTLVQQLNQVISNRYTFHSMIGKVPSMQRVFETVAVVAPSNATVLIEGATGTGKDLLAKVIHSASNRAERPFIKINCAAIPDNLLESELFGYIKGAFTGADRDKPGRFQEADKGTIFLDEIGDLPLSLQAKLLRVLEDKEFYPLGGRNTVKVDVRIISATNQELKKLVGKRLFREDLFYRLNVVQIELPLLKDRRADLPLLIRHIVRMLCTTRARGSCEISQEALKILLNYDYPGNVRELQNILEHALIICQDDIVKPEHLPLSIQHRLSALKEETRQALKSAKSPFPGEREKILKMLQQNNWHRSKTAQALGIDRTTLWRKMKTFGLAPTIRNVEKINL